MRRNIAAVAFLLTLLVIQSLAPQPSTVASADPNTSGGRAGPPVNGTPWDITTIWNITTDLDFSGNITVYGSGTLRIMNHARLRIIPTPSFHYIINVKAGAFVQIENKSILEADHFYAEPSTGLNIMSGSSVSARGLLEADGSCYVNDSTITVTGSPGLSFGEAGAPAKLVLHPGGQIRNSVLSVTGGDGASSENGTGAIGGAGGDATLVMTSGEFSTVRATVRSGHGGNGGAGGRTSINGGPGGSGGHLTIRMNGNILSNTVITGLTGYGGNGSVGDNPASGDGGLGGRGGDGGSADLQWNGKTIDISSSNLSIITGNAGRGGDGGVAQRSGNGGSGGDGGTGGSVTAAIEAKGTFSITDSALNFWAGFGPTGGNYGRAMVSGIDGRAGEGGAGGSVTAEIRLVDAFISTNSSLHVAAGDAGSGGAGSAAAKGGTGGTGKLSFNIVGQNMEPTFTVNARALVVRGGRGGDGGRGQGSGLTPGQPGDGGKGGGARIEVVSTNDIKNVEIKWTEVACDPGAPGGAIYPAKIGNPGVGEIFFMTKSLLMENSTATQRMGPVDNNDYWRFVSTKIPESEPFNVSEAGVAEVYYRLSCYVKDVIGNLITDGSATVYLLRSGETVPDSQRTSSFGKAEFLKLGARYVANLEETVRIVTYVASAISDDGNFTKDMSVQLTGDKSMDLFLIQKSHLPVVTVDSPNDKITPILYATNFLRSNGTSEPFQVEGTGADSVENSEQSISLVEIRIGDGPWIPVNLTMPTFNSYKWSYSWDIYNWALEQLTRYPLGIIPAPIAARSFNERFYSNLVQQNITVYLVQIPPPLPQVMIVKPVPSTSDNTNSSEYDYEKMIPFDASVVNSTGTRVIKWAWCFDDSDGYREDYSSPYYPSTNVSYTRDQNDKYMFVILKVFDNESAKRVELLRGGLSYGEFKYDFDQNDGSTIVKLRMHVRPIPPPPPPGILDQYRWYIISALVVLVLMGSAVMVFRLRTKQIIERREKEDRESLRVEVPDTNCARCGEPLADPAAGCLQCRAQDTLSVVQQSILRLKDSGVNITDAEKVLEEGVDAFDSKAFQEAITKANAAKDKATQLENKFAETSKFITGWETKVAEIRVNTPEADLTEPETKVYHARLALGRGDHVEAVKHLDGIEPLLEKASKAGMRKGTQELIDSTKRMIANIEKRGIILDKKVAAVVEQANFALQQSEYELAQEHCKEAESLVKDTNRLFIKASTTLRQSEERVLDAKGTAKPVGTTEDMLRQARAAMTVGSYASVTELTGKILGFFGVSAKAPAPKRVDWKKEVAVLEGPGAAPAAPGRPAAKPVASAAAPLPLLEMEVSPDQKDAADRMMKEAGQAIALAREQALDVSDGEDLLTKAREAYMARRFPEASELSKSARFLMEELAGAAGAKPRPRIGAPAIAAATAAAKAPAPAAAPPVAVATEPKLSIDKAEALIARLSKVGADVSGLETMVMRAKSARDGGSPVVALQFAKDALNQGEDLMREYETAIRDFGLAERVLAVARSRNLDTADAEFQLRQARNAMAGGAFGRVADTATLVLTMLREMDPSLEKATAGPAPPAAAPAAAQAAPAPAPPMAPIPAAAPSAPAETVQCPGCSRSVKSGWKSCPFCGAKIVPAGEKPAAPAAPAPGPVAPAPPAPLPVAPAPPAPAPVARPSPVAAAPSVSGATCPKCKASVKAHWKVCPSCGSSLAPSAPAPPAPAATASAKAATDAADRCPACGAKVSPGMTQCPLCRTALASDKGAQPQPEPPKKVITISKPVITPPAAVPAAPKPAPLAPLSAAAAAPKPAPMAPAPAPAAPKPAPLAPPSAAAAAPKPAPTAPAPAPAAPKPAPAAPPAATAPAPSKPLIIPPKPAPPPVAADQSDAAKRPVLKVVKKKVVIKKKGDEEE